MPSEHKNRLSGGSPAAVYRAFRGAFMGVFTENDAMPPGELNFIFF